jgi:hypothetical protein
MIPALEEKSHNSWKAFGRGFADGLGSMGNLVVLCRRDHVRRTVQETKRRNWQTDWSMIRGDFKIALGKFHEPRKER